MVASLDDSSLRAARCFRVCCISAANSLHRHQAARILSARSSQKEMLERVGFRNPTFNTLFSTVRYDHKSLSSPKFPWGDAWFDAGQLLTSCHPDAQDNFRRSTRRARHCRFETARGSVANDDARSPLERKMAQVSRWSLCESFKSMCERSGQNGWFGPGGGPREWWRERRPRDKQGSRARAVNKSRELLFKKVYITHDTPTVRRPLFLSGMSFQRVFSVSCAGAVTIPVRRRTDVAMELSRPHAL